MGSALRTIRENRAAYVAINVVYYGLVVLAMIFVAAQPEIQKSLGNAVAQGFTSGPLSMVGEAYTSGDVMLAATITLAVNFFLGTLLYISLPSLIIPFAGLPMGVVRAVLWGLLLSPASPDLRLAMIPHSLTLLLEGQAYIVAIFASFVLWKTAFSRSAGMSFSQRYGVGFRRFLRLHLLVVILLVVAAVYEALEVIFIVPLLV
jgi:preprotein translocase subunit SecG